MNSLFFMVLTDKKLTYETNIEHVGFNFGKVDRLIDLWFWLDI